MEWSDEPIRTFEAGVVVTVSNAKGVLARVASAITSAEADINFVNMPDEVSGQETADLRFVIAVRDTPHIEVVLRNLRRLQSVMKADRVTSGSARDSHPSSNR